MVLCRGPFWGTSGNMLGSLIGFRAQVFGHTHAKWFYVHEHSTGVCMCMCEYVCRHLVRNIINLCSLIHLYTGTGWQRASNAMRRFCCAKRSSTLSPGQTKVKELSHKSESEVLLEKALLKP